METQVAKTSQIKSFFERDAVKVKFEQMLGKRAPQFISSILQITSNSAYLKNAEPSTVYNAAMMAATLDLPINQNLGFAWIVPYKSEAQFQIGWKGIVQLALRTGQYEAINVTEVYDNQFESFNYLTEELKGNFSIQGVGKVVGYACYFKLISGFSKTTYWSLEQVQAHGKRFSKSFANGPWKTDFDAMAKKTVLKNTISKWGILSIEMQTAVKIDQAVIKDDKGEQVEYVDHEEIKTDPFEARALNFIKECTTLIDLEVVWSDIQNQIEGKASEELTIAYQGKTMDLQEEVN